VPVVRGPRLEGAALATVRHRGSHLQIIASAGSGKTEVVAQRVADLLADGVAAGAIVAFTFTKRAAAELRQRIAERAEDRPAERRPLPLPATPGAADRARRQPRFSASGRPPFSSQPDLPGGTSGAGTLGPAGSGAGVAGCLES
jgi:hypothetical protein